MNPEKAGWHWLSYAHDAVGRTTFCKLWFHSYWVDIAGKNRADDQEVSQNYRYLSPCITPAEVAQAVAQAREEALSSATYACQQVIGRFTGDAYEGINDDLRADGARACLREIGALIPTPSQEDRTNG
jgi:hypothetical protein